MWYFVSRSKPSEELRLEWTSAPTARSTPPSERTGRSRSSRPREATREKTSTSNPPFPTTQSSSSTYRARCKTDAGQLYTQVDSPRSAIRQDLPHSCCRSSNNERQDDLSFSDRHRGGALDYLGYKP